MIHLNLLITIDVSLKETSRSAMVGGHFVLTINRLDAAYICSYLSLLFGQDSIIVWWRAVERNLPIAYVISRNIYAYKFTESTSQDNSTSLDVFNSLR